MKNDDNIIVVYEFVSISKINLVMLERVSFQ